jgi:hypothetical protein
MRCQPEMVSGIIGLFTVIMRFYEVSVKLFSWLWTVQRLSSYVKTATFHLSSSCRNGDIFLCIYFTFLQFWRYGVYVHTLHIDEKTWYFDVL